MKRTSVGYSGLVVALAAVFFTHTAGAVEGDAIRKKQQAQEKAKLLSRELVSSVLEI